MAWRNHISVDRGIQGGRPVITGTRVPVQVIVGSLAGGMTPEEVSAEYRVTEEQARAALAYAAEMVASERIVVLE